MAAAGPQSGVRFAAEVTADLAEMATARDTLAGALQEKRADEQDPADLAGGAGTPTAAEVTEAPADETTEDPAPAETEEAPAAEATAASDESDTTEA